MNNDQVRLHVLDNGLQLLGEQSLQRKSAAIGFFVRTGSRDESSKESGISHFLEHMMFKGTKTRSALDVTFALGNIGAQANAFTSEENTVYYAAVLPEYFPRMQELLCDMLRPALDLGEFETERKVILEEIALYQDRPQFYLFEKALRDYFGRHPAGKSVLGSKRSIGAMTRDEMAAYFERRYSPKNMILTAAGAFDWEAFLADAKRFCDKWPSFPAQRRLRPHAARAIKREYRKKNINQAHLVLISEGCSAQDDARYPLAVLSLIIGDCAGSKFYWELVDKGIVESAGADNDERDGTGIFMAYASMEPARVDQVSQIMRGILKNPSDFSDGDLQRAKTKLISKIVLNGELPLGRLMSVGTDWLYRGKVDTLPRMVERIKCIARSDIDKALQQYPLRVWSEFRLLPK